MIKTCEYPGCHRASRFLNSWNNETSKHFGLVCATHDKELGRKNLIKYMPLEEAILFERYMHEVPDEVFYPDFPEWLTRMGKTCTPLTLTKAKPALHTEKTSTELLGLSPRVWNVLRRSRIDTIGKLINTSPYELSKIRTLGVKAICEIQEKLKEFAQRRVITGEEFK